MSVDSAQFGHARARESAGFSLVVLAWGAQAIVTQTLLLREATVLMLGTELAWGVVLAGWLAGVAVGGVIGGRLADRLRSSDAALAAGLAMLAVAACVLLWSFRSARGWLGAGPGELLSLAATAKVAVLLVPPAGALVGMAFPLACRTIRGGPVAASGALGRVYALESAGSLIGGMAFTFWAVGRWPPIVIALCCAVLTTGSCAVWLLVRKRMVAGGCLAALAAAAFVTAMAAGNTLDRRLVERRWRDLAPGAELVANAESRYQSLALGEREGQFSLYADGRVAATFPDPYTYAPLAHFWMCQHPSPTRVLLIGGGAEGLLAEILRHPVLSVDYVEPDARQVDLIEPYLPDADRRALLDPRVVTHFEDPRRFVKTQRDRFDLVIARLPDPISALTARLYTREFFLDLRRALMKRSVLCLTAASAPSRLSPAAAEYLASLRATIRQGFPHVIVGWGDPAHVLAATKPDLLTTVPAVLRARYEQREVRSEHFDASWFDGATDWLDPEKIAWRASELDAARPTVSRDLRPFLYVQRLAARDAMLGSSSGGVVTRLRSVRAWQVCAALTLLALATLGSFRLRARSTGGWSRGAVVLSVAGTGFATMALSLVWLFAFQSLYGYVYQRIGWIIAVFMAGLVVGSWWMARRRPLGLHSAPAPHRASLASHSGLRGLIVVDVLLAGLALFAPLMLTALASLQTTPAALALIEWSLTLLVLVTGVLGGAAFALAGRWQAAREARAGAAAGVIVGADHAGACLGALLTGILLVPVFGTPATAFLLAGLKLVSAFLLIVVRKSGKTPDGGA